MRVLVTGGAGFIGSFLCEQLLKQNYVVCLDNLSGGSFDNMKNFFHNKNFKFLEHDVLDTEFLEKILKNEKIDMVFHLASNVSILESSKNPRVDLDNTFLTTYSVLEAMRRTNVKKLFFSSTSAVYGNRPNEAMKESMGELMPINYYGAAKLASESYIIGYSKMNDFDVVMFRFANVIGPNLTHGVIFDFVRKLLKDKTCLEILGNGKQQKPYIYVEDLVNGILLLTQKDFSGINIFNIGTDDDITVTEIANLVKQKMDLPQSKLNYTGGEAGWKGDVPKYSFDCSKIKQFGWKAKYNSKQAVEQTLDDFLKSINYK